MIITDELVDNLTDELIEKMMESKKIQELYDTYIIKDITFKEWVIGMIEELDKLDRRYKNEK